jgi:hypothetical protein
MSDRTICLTVDKEAYKRLREAVIIMQMSGRNMQLPVEALSKIVDGLKEEKDVTLRIKKKT